MSQPSAKPSTARVGTAPPPRSEATSSSDPSVSASASAPLPPPPQYQYPSNPQTAFYQPQFPGYAAPPQYPGGWAVQVQPYPINPNTVVVVGGMGMTGSRYPQMDPVEATSLTKWKEGALFCSISSLVCTWLLCFSIPAIVCACKEIYEPAAKYSYRTSIILSSVAWVITIAWVIFVAVYVSVVVSSAVATVNTYYSYSSSLGGSSCSYSSYYYTYSKCLTLKSTNYTTYSLCCSKYY